MDVLYYNALDPGDLKTAFERTVAQLQRGDFAAAEVKKLHPHPFYRAKLNQSDRLLFQFGRYQGRTYLLLLEIIRNHDYAKSRFLNGASIDESRLAIWQNATPAAESDPVNLLHVSPHRPHFHVLDKIIAFDDEQNAALHLAPPLILIGSAGSGKTILSLEKLKFLQGEVLYITRSAYLAENARNLYYANDYSNDDQEIQFLSFKEYLETIHMPEGREITFQIFENWFTRHAYNSGLKDAHKVFEEFNGVITGSIVDQPYLAEADYLPLGVRRSIFSVDERPRVYALFLKYLDFLRREKFFDLNMSSFYALPHCTPRYDFVVVDEVQDLTNIQVALILKSLRSANNFILCGDANQIVHPNFFSWAQLKTMFYTTRSDGRREIVRVLNANYRNTPAVTDLANRLLLIKNARFGSIDRESNYLVRSVSTEQGAVELLANDQSVKRLLNENTRRSARCAVLCLRNEDKAQVHKEFQTPLVFSVQEAKGLEYETVILYNFISLNQREYRELVAGVTAEDLQGDLSYSRAKDKTDKSLEVYKFYVNALYVAMTRAIRNVYLIEADTRHPLLGLLGLHAAGREIRVQAQQSSAAEWKAEARKLELQGKQEQADAIRRNILQIQSVPWPVLSHATLPELEKEAFDPARFNKQAKSRLYEYAVVYNAKPLLRRLAEFGFARAYNAATDCSVIENKYLQDYLAKEPRELWHKIELYGPNFRNPLNQTPLMLAARVGRVDIVQRLLKEGADLRLRDNWGRTALQIALRQAYRDQHYAHQFLGQIYNLLAPPSMNVRSFGVLTKLDKRCMEYFLLNSMIAMLQDIFREKALRCTPGFATQDFVPFVAYFPEQVLPLWRRKRPYISSVLARNEIFRRLKCGHALFMRLERGFYLPNPAMDIEIAEDEWVNIYDLIHLREWEQTGADEAFGEIVDYLEQARKTLLTYEGTDTSPAALIPAEASEEKTTS